MIERGRYIDSQIDRKIRDRKKEGGIQIYREIERSEIDRKREVYRYTDRLKNRR